MTDGLPLPRRRIAAAALLAAIALVVIDSSIVNIALPIFATQFAVSPSESIWIVTSYQIALVIALLPCSALGESLGYRRVFLFGIVLFTASSALCITASSLVWLAFGRFLQGLGGAAVMSVIAALLRFTYPSHLLGTALGWNAMTVALSSAAGPAVGSAILSVASWHWLFAVNIPIGLAVYALSRQLPDEAGVRRKLDYVSIILNAGFFAPLVIGLGMLQSRTVLALALVAIAIICLTVLIRREMHNPSPLFPLDLLRNKQIRLSVIASLCCFSAQTASYIAIPFYLQHTLARDTLDAGLFMTPWPLAIAFAAPLAGKMSQSVSTAKLCLIGCLCLALGLALSAVWPLERNLLPLIAFNIIAGVGFGFFQTPNNRNMLLSVPRERAGAAGGMQATARLLGQTGGAVIMGMLFSLVAVDTAPRVGLAVSAALAFAGGIVSAVRIATVKPER